MVRDMARDFAASRLAPNAATWDREAHVPREVRYGNGNARAARHDGCGALGRRRRRFRFLCAGGGGDRAGDGGVSTIMNVNNSPCVRRFKPSAPMRRNSAFSNRSPRAGCSAHSASPSPRAGSDASNLRTRAERRGNQFVLNGTKQFVTSGSIADVAMVFAVTDPEAGKRGISAFLAPTESPGYRVAGVEKKLGQRSSDTCQIVLEDLELTPDLMLGDEGQGYKIALANLESGRIGIAAQAVGMARAAYDAGLATPASARPSVRRSWSTRQWPFDSPTWRHASKPPAGWCTRQRNSRTPASPASRRRRWPSCSPRRWQKQYAPERHPDPWGIRVPG